MTHKETIYLCPTGSYNKEYCDARKEKVKEEIKEHNLGAVILTEEEEVRGVRMYYIVEWED